MGIRFSTENIMKNVSEYVIGKKRKHCDSEDEEVNKIIDIALHTPKRFVYCYLHVITLFTNQLQPFNAE